MLRCNDTITTTFNNNTLNGGDGADIISTSITGRTVDLLIFQNGQAGQDIMTANVNAAARYFGSVLNGGTGADTITTNTTLGNVFQDTLLESYALGGAGGDSINMTAALNGGGNLWQEANGGAGTDDITMSASTTGGANATAYNFVDGGTGDDEVVATVQGNAGSTVFNELYGDDGVSGGLLGPSSNDTITGIVIGEGSSYIYGGYGNDTRCATGGSENELYGGAGSDVLRGSTGVDYFTGGAGVDVFYLDSGGVDVITDCDTGILGTFIGGDILAFEPGTDVSLVDVIVGGSGLLEIQLAGNTVVSLQGIGASLLGQVEGILDALGFGSQMTGEVPG